MGAALRIRCDCGQLQGVFRGVAAGHGNRTVCYCRDCQAFARFLERPDVLDAHGGTEIFQHSPRGLVFTEGSEQLACLRFGDKGMLRWYAACCRTPIANTPPSPSMCFVGLIRAAWNPQDDALLGPVRNRVQAQSAVGDTTELAADKGIPLPVFARVLWILLKARLRGDHRHSPFFDAATGQPRVPPQVLSAEARRALDGSTEARSRGPLLYCAANTGGSPTMTKLAREPYGPKGDPKRHLSLAELRAGLEALPPEPDSERGRVACIVRRLADGSRECLDVTELSAELGVAGDGWSRRPPRDPESQIAVMRHAVARLIANGQDLTLFGDNFFVDFDISAANLPPGSRLRVGTAVVAVTAKPHNGCAKFHERFGDDALRFVQAPATRHRNLRGIFWKVLEGGTVRAGDAIVVLMRAGA